MRSKSTWIAVTFLVGAALATFVLNRAFGAAFASFNVSNRAILGDNFTLTTLIALVISAGVAFYGYSHAASKTFVSEVFDEVSKVAWPEWAETKTNTLVTIVFSFVAAGILGVFDSVFAWLTNNNLFLY